MPSRATTSNFFLFSFGPPERWDAKEKPAPRAAEGGGVS
jgi:hypothetical protein